MGKQSCHGEEKKDRKRIWLGEGLGISIMKTIARLLKRAALLLIYTLLLISVISVTRRISSSVHEHSSSKMNVVSIIATRDEFNALAEARKSVVDEACARMKARPTERFTFNFQNLLVQPDLGLTYCPVFKASSSNWMINWLEISSLSKVYY